MCIIVVKKAGVRMPGREILEKCFKNNPDGAGFMYSDGKGVHIKKGFMSFYAFNKAIRRTNRKIYGGLTSVPMVMHFRIATHGGVSSGNCHPFPITDNYETMRNGEFTCRAGYAHNGIIRSMSTDDDIKNCGVSDTMVFGKKKLYPIYIQHNQRIPQKKEELDKLSHILGSKLVMLDKSGKLETVGEFEENNGIMFSNSSYKESRYKYTNFSYINLYSGANSNSDYSDHKAVIIPFDAYFCNKMGELNVALKSLFSFNYNEDLFKLMPDGSWNFVDRTPLFDEYGQKISYGATLAVSDTKTVSV